MVAPGWARSTTVTVVAAVACAWPYADASAAKRDKNAPRAEVQIGLCADADAIERALALRPREAPYETWQFDDAALSLLGHGVRVRLRAKESESELTIKIAGQDCNTLPDGLVPRRQGKCEFDVYGASRDGAVSLTRRLDTGATRELLAGRMTVTQALSPAQIRYLREVLGFYPLPADLRALGPITNRAYVTKDSGYEVDLSQLPGGERYAEISKKVPQAAIDPTFRALDVVLRQAGIAACADQTSQAAAKLRLLLQRN